MDASADSCSLVLPRPGNHRPKTRVQQKTAPHDLLKTERQHAKLKIQVLIIHHNVSLQSLHRRIMSHLHVPQPGPNTLWI